MSLTINAKQAVKVAAFAVAWEMVSPSTALSTIGAIALGIISTYCVEAASNYVETDSKAKRRTDMLRNTQLYEVARLPDFDPKVEVESLNRAFERFKNHQVLYKYYLKISPLRGIYANGHVKNNEHMIKIFEKGTCYSDFEVLELMRKDLEKGCCNGQVSHLLQIIKETSGLLNPEVIAKMHAEEVFYRHQLHVAHIFFQTVIDIKAGIIENKCNAYQMNHPSLLLEKFDKEAFKQKKLTKYKNEIENLETINSLASARKSQNFLATSSVENYERILEKTISTLSTQDPVIGALQMHKHILAFQYSPEGYYIYDATAGALFKYPDKETFFQKLREQVLYDLDIVSETQGKSDISMEISFKIIKKQ
jgi:hypothetical protein